MKKFFIIASASILSMGFSCNKEDIKITFPIAAGEFTFTIPAGAPAGEQVFHSTTLNFNVDSFCQANSTNKDQITSITAKTVTFEIIDTDPSLNFNAADWGEAWVSGTVLPKVKVAEIRPMPTNVRLVSLTLPPQELVDYAKSGSLIVEAKGRTNATLTTPINVRCKIEVNVSAGL